MASYTPQQRRMYLKGLRIWARVAIRSYMRKHGVALDSPSHPEVDGADQGRG